MTPSYPFFGFPGYRRPYPYYYGYKNSHNSNVNSIKNEQKPCFPSNTSQREQGKFSCSSNFSKNSGTNRERLDSCNHNNGYAHNNSNIHNNSNTHCNSNSCDNSNFHNGSSHIDDCNIDEEQECFEIFGLKLYFDDLLIIALLFFLYQEEVKDSYLYISLILLLLS